MTAPDLFPTWDDLAASGLLAITFNRHAIDCYSAVFRDGDVLTFNDVPTMPCGFSQWGGECLGASDVWAWLDGGQYQGGEVLLWPRVPPPADDPGAHKLGDEPPEWMRTHVLARINEAYRDTLAAEVAAGAEIEDARGTILDECFTHAPLSDD